jgi:hypothetical protein
LKMREAFGHYVGVLQTLVEVRVEAGEAKVYSSWMNSSLVCR